jgi:hypothetical protein
VYKRQETNSAVFGIYLDRSYVDVTRNDGYKAIENPNDRPGDPSDDYFIQPDISKASITRIKFKFGLLF